MISLKQFKATSLFGTLLILVGCSEQDCRPPRLDGYTYDVVQIGEHCWFSENLRTHVYLNGDILEYALDDEVWKSSQTGLRCQYNHESEMGDSYGQLYNGHAVVDQRGLCPTGWRIPLEEDWQDLVAFVSEEASLGISVEGWDGMAYWEVGEFLKDSCCWWPDHLLRNPEFKASNAFGFNAVPSGERSFGGFFSGAGEYGSAKWWTASFGDGEIPYRFVTFQDSSLFDANAMRTRGFAIRCVRDVE